MIDVLFLCTGNATRSVLAAALLQRAKPQLRVESAGTLAVEGCVMSWRTRAAFAAIDLAVPVHRSKQATSTMLHSAQLIVGLAPEHVHWVRRNDAPSSSRTTTLKHLVSEPAAIDWSTRALASWEEVVDPGGQEVVAFENCAREIADLIADLCRQWATSPAATLAATPADDANRQMRSMMVAVPMPPPVHMVISAVDLS